MMTYNYVDLRCGKETLLWNAYSGVLNLFIIAMHASNFVDKLCFSLQRLHGRFTANQDNSDIVTKFGQIQPRPPRERASENSENPQARLNMSSAET